MEGFFVHKGAGSWLFLLCGIFFLGLYVFLNTVDPAATGEVVIFIILGVVLCLSALISLQFNRGAHLCVDKAGIRARYHWCRKLDCAMGDVAFVLPQMNTLTILLKSGKCHTIMGVENSWELSRYIRRECFAPEAESPDDLRRELESAQAGRKTELGWVITGTVLMFANIFITVYLTGGRDLNAFGPRDWTVFGVMGIVELATVLGLFRAAGGCGKYLLPIEALKYRLRRAVILSQPLPLPHPRRIYTDEDHTGRVIVCGFPNDEDVYYCVEEFSDSLHLETVFTSEIYTNTQKRPEDEFCELLDLTPFLLP